MTGVEKTISFLILIFIGILLKRKMGTKEELKGLKTLILCIALPAIIFIALLKINVSLELIYLPLAVLGINFLMLGGTKVYCWLMRESEQASTNRTLLMLLPSLAPGLSCLPFISEYLGEENLAIAALADVGNKIFVLIILYLLAMTWYFRSKSNSDSSSIPDRSNRMKELILNLASEPINMVIIVALVMLGLGLNFNSIPAYGQSVIMKVGAMMTPLVLIFIGLAVDLEWKQSFQIIRILLWRSGFAFILSGFLIFILPPSISTLTLLLIVIFPQSSCSFWPFAHMSAISELEKENSLKTFDMKLAVNLLAFSLLFSTILIITICSTGPLFTNPFLLFGIGIIGMSLSILSTVFKAKKLVKEPVIVTR